MEIHPHCVDPRDWGGSTENLSESFRLLKVQKGRLVQHPSCIASNTGVIANTN
jgi:hypothetical protein